MRVWIAVGAMLFIGACGSSAAPRVETEPASLDLPRPPEPPLVVFPSVEEMDRIAPQLPTLDPALVQGATGTVVERWELGATPATADQPYTAEGAAETVLDEIAQSAGVALRRSASIRCAAAEFARFHAEHGNHAFDWLRRYVLGACGSLVNDVTVRSLAIDRTVDEEPFVRNGRAHVEEMLRNAVGPDRLIAVGFHRGTRRTALIVAYADPPPLTLEPWHGPDADGIVRLRGPNPETLGELRAVITHGPHGARQCSTHRTLREFAIDCPMAETDPAAQVEVFASVGEILLRQVASISVERNPGTTPPFAFTPTPAATLDPEQVLATVNSARQAAGLDALSLAPQSSAIHQRIMPPLFGTPTNAEQRAALDRLALGLRAGHGLEDALIRDAMTMWSVERGEGAANRIVTRLLSSAWGRMALMNPGRGQLAVGVQTSVDPPYVTLVASGYMVHDDTDRAGEAERVFERLSDERAIRGLAPPRRVPELPNLTRAARRMEAGELSRDAALEQGLRADLPAIGGRARSLTTTALTLDRFLVAPALLAPELSVGIVVARAPIQGSRWAHYIIYFVIT